MVFSKKKKYVKYELNYKQKQKVVKLAKKLESNPDTIVNKIELFLDESSDVINLDSWQTILAFLNLKLLEQTIRQKSDDVIETKKKIKIQQKLLEEYEDDYMAIVSLGEALESLNKL
ncbi:MAG: hypothetical protein ACTSQ4_10645 [Candidatus Heimdallarchaeaceae archaeon]